MTNSDPTCAATRANTAPARASADMQPGSGLGLTRGQRVLATATAAAVLASGLNGVVQVLKVLVERWLTRS